MQFSSLLSSQSCYNAKLVNIATTYCVVSWFLFLSTLMMYGYMPAQRAALTTAQFSELVFKSRISPGPLARTKPEALS